MTYNAHDSATIFRHIAVVALLCVLLLAACGDVQGAENARTLSIDGRGSSYLAVQGGVQDGPAAWQPLTPGADAPYQVTLTTAEGRYGVLSLCFDTATGSSSVTVQHGVVAETPVVSATCLADPVEKTISVLGDVTGLSQGEYGNVYLGYTSALVDSVTPTMRLELPRDLSASRYDLIASRYEGEAHIPNRLVLEPGLELGPTGELGVDFDGPFSFEPEVTRLLVTGVRPGELLSGSVELIVGATAARVGEYSGGDVLTYARMPEGVKRRLAQASGQASAPRVNFRASVQGFSYNDRTKAGSSRGLSRTLPDTYRLGGGKAAAPTRINLPAPLRPPTLALRGTLDLHPQTSWQLHPAGRGVYTQFYSQIQAGHTVSYRLSQSSAWLGGRPPRYLLPNLNALPDWQTEWNLARGEPLFWDVSFTQKSAVKELFVSRSGVLTP